MKRPILTACYCGLLALFTALTTTDANAQYQTKVPPVHHHSDFVSSNHHDPYCDHSCYYGPCRCGLDCFQCFNRSLPPGNMSARMPYHALRIYYYDRPYNALHVDTRVRSQNWNSAKPPQPYSRRVFESVYEKSEQQILDGRSLDFAGQNATHASEADHEQISRDKNLEFVDWRKHHRARMKWEQQKLPRIQQSSSMESPLELRDAGHSGNN